MTIANIVDSSDRKWQHALTAFGSICMKDCVCFKSSYVSISQEC